MASVSTPYSIRRVRDKIQINSNKSALLNESRETKNSSHIGLISSLRKSKFSNNTNDSNSQYSKVINEYSRYIYHPEYLNKTQASMKVPRSSQSVKRSNYYGLDQQNTLDTSQNRTMQSSLQKLYKYDHNEIRPQSTGFIMTTNNSFYNKNHQEMNTTKKSFRQSSTIQVRSQAKKKTNIKIIDDYYKNVNQDEELLRIKFMTEYQRLLDSINKIWNAHHIPTQEQTYVSQVLQSYLSQNGHYDHQLLTKMNEYILFLQKLVQIDNNLKNIGEERDSLIIKLKQLAQNNNFPVFQTIGVNLMVQIRELTLKFIHLLQIYSKSLQSQQIQNYEVKQSQGCYICKMKKNDAQSMQLISIILRKLSIFMNSLLLFIPKDNETIMVDLQELKSRRISFSLQEMSQFDGICIKLREGISNQKQVARIENAIQFIDGHICEASDLPYEDKSFRCGSYYKFNWNLNSFQQTKYKQERSSRIQSAYSRLRLLKTQEDKMNGHLDSGSETEHQDILNIVNNQIGYRQTISIFENKQNTDSHFASTVQDNSIEVDQYGYNINNNDELGALRRDSRLTEVFHKDGTRQNDLLHIIKETEGDQNNTFNVAIEENHTTLQEDNKSFSISEQYNVPSQQNNVESTHQVVSEASNIHQQLMQSIDTQVQSTQHRAYEGIDQKILQEIPKKMRYGRTIKHTISNSNQAHFKNNYQMYKPQNLPIKKNSLRQHEIKTSNLYDLENNDYTLMKLSQKTPSYQNEMSLSNESKVDINNNNNIESQTILENQHFDTDFQKHTKSECSLLKEILIEDGNRSSKLMLHTDSQNNQEYANSVQQDNDDTNKKISPQIIIEQ